MLPIQKPLIGSQMASNDQFRHVASLQTQRHQHICGAAIIKDYWVITAAACTKQLKDLNEVFVRTGSHSFSSGGVRHSVSKIINHPRFSVGSRVNDIALVKTRTAIERNVHTAPIALPRSDITSGHATIAGWGQRDTAAAAKSVQLRSLATRIISAADCRKGLTPVQLSRYLTTTNMCTNAGEGHGICRGDIGSPLNVGAVLVGISSFGDSCATGAPDVYTRVFSYVKWVTDNAK